jgi:hypothetical protein
MQEEMNQDMRSTLDEFALFMEVVQALLEHGYAQGRFDAQNGFNTFSSVSDMVRKWMSENDDILCSPLDHTGLLARLRDGTRRVSGDGYGEQHG